MLHRFFDINCYTLLYIYIFSVLNRFYVKKYVGQMFRTKSITLYFNSAKHFP